MRASWTPSGVRAWFLDHSTLSESTIIIRTAIESDLDAMSKAFAPDLARAQLANRLTEQRAGLRSMLVLEWAGEIVGTVSIDPNPDSDGVTRRLFALDVVTRHRRQGFGTMLVNEVEKLALAVGNSAVRLDVAVDNLGAIALYEKLGYERVGEPVVLKWTQMVDGTKSEIVTESCHRMVKRLR